jgi:hypothetical protein
VSRIKVIGRNCDYVRAELTRHLYRCDGITYHAARDQDDGGHLAGKRQVAYQAG